MSHLHISARLVKRQILVQLAATLTGLDLGRTYDLGLVDLFGAVGLSSFEILRGHVHGSRHAKWMADNFAHHHLVRGCEGTTCGGPGAKIVLARLFGATSLLVYHTFMTTALAFFNLLAHAVLAPLGGAQTPESLNVFL